MLQMAEGTNYGIVPFMKTGVIGLHFGSCRCGFAVGVMNRKECDDRFRCVVMQQRIHLIFSSSSNVVSFCAGMLR